jgi:alkane 1-monooxygenase
MDPKVVAHYRGDMGRANIKPGMRDRVLARYAPAPAAVSPTA